MNKPSERIQKIIEEQGSGRNLDDKVAAIITYLDEERGFLPFSKKKIIS